MLNNLLLASENTSSIIWLVLLVVMVVVMLVLPSVTQKKRVKAYQEMQDRLRAGDKIQTIGGIVGKISKIKESNGVKTILVETGDKNNKVVLEFDINAIAGVVEGIPNPNASEPQVTETENSKEVEEKPEEIDVSFDEVKEEKPEEPKKKANSKKK